MKKIIKFTIAAVLLVSVANAQEWTKMIQDPNANFYDIVKEFDNYWKERPYERGKGYNVFKRWQWFTEPRVYPSGNLKFASQGYAMEQYQKFLAETVNTGKNTGPSQITATTANWVPMGPYGSPGNGGDAGRIQTIKMHPAGTNTFYVGAAAGGFWKTTDAGATYVTTTDQLGSCGVSDIAISSASTNVIYISTGDKDAGDTHSTGVLKSLDGGNTWNTTGLTWLVSSQQRIYRLLVDPANVNSLIAATSQGMYRSIDGGTTWSLSIAGNFVDAEYRPGDVTVVHAVTSNAYFRSNDGGATYTAFSIVNGISANRLSLAVSAANNNAVYILASKPDNSFGGLFRSTNMGTAFTLMSSTPNLFGWNTSGSDGGGQGWYDIAIDASPTSSNEIVVGGVNSWKSINGGSNWTLHTHWTGGGGKPYVHADLHYVLYATGTTVFLGTDGGIARSTNGGTNWTTINGNMNIAQQYKFGLSASSPSLIVAGHQDNGINLLNGGTSWNQIYGADGMDCFISWANNSHIVSASQYGSFRRSLNGGANWTGITSGLTGSGQWLAPIVQSPASANTYYCAYQNVFKSTNQGTNWVQKGTIGVTLDEIKISPSNTNIIYVTHSGAVLKTLNDGVNWLNVTGSIPFGSAAITDLAINNTNPNNVFVTLSGYTAGNKVYKTIDGGITWANYSTGLPNVPISSIVYQNNSPNIVYIGTDVGVFYREASMSSWVPYTNGLPTISITDLEIYYPTGKLRAATYARGVWETDLYSTPGAVPVATFGTLYSSACVNTPIQFTDLSANTPTAWVWAFNSGAPATSTVQNPLITYTAAGIYTVNLVSTNGNGASTPYVGTVTVVNAPTVSTVPKTICSGDPANLQVITNGNMVNWSNGSQGFYLQVNNTVTTVYSFTSNLGACQTTGSYTIFVDQYPVLPTVINIGNYLTTTVVATTYQWHLDGLPIPGATAITYTPSVEGWYAVSAANGSCEIISEQLQILGIGIKEMTIFQGLSLAPNPVKEQLILSFKNAVVGDIAYEIQNNLGQIVLKSNLKTDENFQSKIYLQQLVPGIYNINLKVGERRSVYKFIKQ